MLKHHQDLGHHSAHLTGSIIFLNSIKMHLTTQNAQTYTLDLVIHLHIWNMWKKGVQLLSLETF